jgi:hypothetical protein
VNPSKKPAAEGPLGGRPWSGPRPGIRSDIEQRSRALDHDAFERPAERRGGRSSPDGPGGRPPKKRALF